jgi:flagellar biosynthesis/type III secretory pathway ATPase
MDDKGPIEVEAAYPVYADPINPLKRSRITEPMDLGVRRSTPFSAAARASGWGCFQVPAWGRAFSWG